MFSKCPNCHLIEPYTSEYQGCKWKKTYIDITLNTCMLNMSMLARKNLKPWDILLKTQSQYQFLFKNNVNFKVFKIKISKWPPLLYFWIYIQTLLTLNEQNYIIKNLVKTKSQNQCSLRNYVNIIVVKFKMAAIFEVTSKLQWN